MRRTIPLLLSLTVLTACTARETAIKESIAEANFCETAADCVLVGHKCPFGCYIYANAAEADRIRTLVEGYESRCEYGCIQSFGVECQDNKCVSITDDPLTDEETSE